MINEYFLTNRYKIIDEKDDAKILLFPDIPFWIVTNDDGISVLDNLDGNKTLKDISKKVFGRDNLKEIEMFLKPLLESDVIYKKGRKYEFNSKITSMNIRPDKITVLPTMKCNFKIKPRIECGRTE